MQQEGHFIRNAKRVTMRNVELRGYEGEALDIAAVDEWERM